MKNLSNPFKTASLITALFLIHTLAHAATNVSAGTLSSAHWTTSGSPYKIMGHIIVANNDSLVIDPGVTVEFQGKYKLFCNGKIIANGTSGQHILFTAANTTTGWLGIRYDNTPSTNGQSLFRYCTLEYGRADVTGDNLGGGMYFKNFSNCIISNCVFQNCYAQSGGGAIYADHASPTISLDTFYNNSTNTGGYCVDFYYSASVIDRCLFKNSGVYCMYSSLKITNNYFIKCTYEGGVSSFSHPTTGYLEITHNFFDSCAQSNGGGGGAILLCNAQAKIEHNVFKNNVSVCGGGAISVWTQTVYPNSSNTIISNNLFYGNKSHITMNSGAPFGGGAICFSNCSGKVINNTIADNTSDTAGGAIVCFDGSSPSFYNNIIYGNGTNSAPAENIFILDNSSDPNFYYNDIQGGYSGINTNGTPLMGANVSNINTVPFFTNAAGGIYTLASGSPCIDAGDTTGIGALIPALDLAGTTRIVNTKINLGAYENTGATTSLPAINVNASFSISPNPSVNYFAIKGAQLSNVMSIEVMDMQGKKLVIFNNVASNSFDVSGLSTGIYLVKIRAKDEGMQTLRLVKY